MSKLFGGSLVGTVTNACKTMNIIDLDYGLNEINKQVYIDNILLIFTLLCNLFNNPNGEHYKLITSDNLNNISEFINNIHDAQKEEIVKIFFNKNVDIQDIPSFLKEDNEEYSEDLEEDYKDLEEDSKDNEEKSEDNEEKSEDNEEDSKQQGGNIKLENGWIEKTNLKGNKYWYNENTRETSATKPDDIGDAITNSISNIIGTKDINIESLMGNNDKNNSTPVVNMATKQIEDITGIGRDNVESTNSAETFVNTIFSVKITDLIKNNKQVHTRVISFVKKIYNQINKYMKQDVVNNIRYSLKALIVPAYNRFLKEKISIHNNYYNFIIKSINNENDKSLMKQLYFVIKSYFIEIDNMITNDSVLKQELITTLKHKFDVVYNNENDKKNAISTFIDDMKDISDFNDNYSDILTVNNTKIKGGKKVKLTKIKNTLKYKKKNKRNTRKRG